ncbi:MAG TPA: DUF222 domain-containing protein [Actinomycetes bacterium]|nr:DUF222 domain-containing protein [Actinomycetes bacterium]
MFLPEVVPAPIQALLSQVRQVAVADMFGEVGAQDRAAWLAGLREVVDATEALFVQALDAFDANGDGEVLHAASSTQSWLRGALRLAPSDAAERVTLARGRRNGQLAESLTALADGAVTYHQVRVIASAVKTVPEPLAAEAAHLLTDLARQADVTAVRVASRHLRAVVDPDGAFKQAQAQFEGRSLHLSPMLDGMTDISGILDTESAAMLSTALAPFLVPAGPHDARTTAQRRADGLVELARTACDHQLLPEIAGERPHLEVLCPLQTLAPGSVTPARLPGTPAGPVIITPQAAQRIACDAEIGRVVLDADSIPVDIGYRQRLFTPHQRRALALRDAGCRFPGCNRPPIYTDAHHLVHWAEGGPTNLDNGILLCRHHHRHVHETGWRIELNDPTRGLGARLSFVGPGGQRLPSDPARL